MTRSSNPTDTVTVPDSESFWSGTSSGLPGYTYAVYLDTLLVPTPETAVDTFLASDLSRYDARKPHSALASQTRSGIRMDFILTVSVHRDDIQSALLRAIASNIGVNDDEIYELRESVRMYYPSGSD